MKQNDFEVAVLKKDVHAFIVIFKLADKKAKLKKDKTWAELELAKTDKKLEEALTAYTNAIEENKYWFEYIHWLQKGFPEDTNCI